MRRWVLLPIAGASLIAGFISSRVAAPHDTEHDELVRWTSTATVLVAAARAKGCVAGLEFHRGLLPALGTPREPAPWEQPENPYHWDFSDGVRVGRPLHGEACFLDEPIQSYVIADSTVREAIEKLHQMFDPAYRLARPRALVAAPNGQVPTDLLQLQDKRISLWVPKGRVIDVLNAIARAHGRVVWSVRFRQHEHNYRSMVLMFRGYDDWSIVAGPALR